MRAPAASAALAGLELARVRERVRRAAAALERHRRLVLALIVLGQWGGVLAIALSARHNGWLYYHGGDGVWYWTSAWALGHFTLPFAQIGFGLAVFQSIGGALLGQSMLSGLPFVLLLNTLVLLPLVPLLLYAVAERIAGRLFGLAAAALWLVLPLLAYRGFSASYRHDTFLDVFLPGSVGLNALADFPSLVVCLAAAWFALRAIDNGSRTDAVLAGAVAGYAIAVKPANALFLAAPVLGLLAARRLPQTAAFLAALVPAVLALAVWKERGLGSLPLFDSAPGSIRLAAGALPIAGLPDVSRYGGLDWGAIQQNLGQIREVFWSKALLEWIPIAGTFALLRRSFAKGLLVVVWFAAYFLVKGGSDFASVYGTSFFRLLEPAYPAFALMVAACLFLLVPGLRRRAPVSPRPASRRAAVAAVAVLGVVPLVFVAVARPAGRAQFGQIYGAGVDDPIVDLGLHAQVADGAVRLSWRARPSSNATVAYRIYRATTARDDCNTLAEGAHDCVVRSKPIANARGTTFLDRPKPGRYFYRVAVTAAWNHDPASGDALLLSEPVAVTVLPQ